MKSVKKYGETCDVEMERFVWKYSKNHKNTYYNLDAPPITNVTESKLRQIFSWQLRRSLW